MKRARAILLALVLALGTAAGAAAQMAGISAWGWVPFLLAVIFIVYLATDGHPAGDEGKVPLRLRPLQTAPEGADLIRLSSLENPAMVVSTSWQVLAANEGAAELFGQRVVGTDLRQTVRHPVVIETVRLGIEGGNPILREVTTLGSRDGAFRVRAVALDDGRLLLSFADITQARLTERMRVDFVANASHELRTPLANISGFIETLLGPASEDEPARSRFLDIMGREAARMSRLIDDLLSLSRIELDKYVRPQTMLELPPLLTDVGKTLAMRMEADGRKLKIQVEPDLPQVVADRDQILQVLHNLVSNALKYGHSGTPISITAQLEKLPRGDEMVRVSVGDEGDGIAPEHLPRLTERFYRIDTGRSRSMGGTGLGLAIVKHIVERHRGRLEIASHQGEGTVVSFTLPVMALPLRTAEESDSSETVSQNRNAPVT